MAQSDPERRMEDKERGFRNSGMVRRSHGSDEYTSYPANTERRCRANGEQLLLQSAEVIKVEPRAVKAEQRTGSLGSQMQPQNAEVEQL